VEKKLKGRTGMHLIRAHTHEHYVHPFKVRWRVTEDTSTHVCLPDTHTHTHTHTHTNTHTHTHTHTQVHTPEVHTQAHIYRYEHTCTQLKTVMLNKELQDC